MRSRAAYEARGAVSVPGRWSGTIEARLQRSGLGYAFGAASSLRTAFSRPRTNPTHS